MHLALNGEGVCLLGPHGHLAAEHQLLHGRGHGQAAVLQQLVEVVLVLLLPTWDRSMFTII